MSSECPTCDVVFDTEHGMKIHYKQKHGESLANITLTCDQCGSEYDVHRSRRYDSRFCSEKCRDQKFKDEYSRESNPQWKGGETIICNNCGDSFYVEPWEIDEGRQYCSRECSDEGRKTIQTTTCKICGEEFETHEPGRRKTCSMECNRKQISERQQGEDHWNWQGGRVEVTCEVCGDKYFVKKYKENITSTCSNKCNGVKAGRASSDNITKQCAVCGDDFETCKSDYDRRTTCSMECLSNYLSGSGSPLWEGEYTPEYGYEWDEIADRIREENDNTCGRCGNVGEQKLPVHHIVRVREFKNEEDAHFDENLVVLCRSCHSYVEWNWSVEKQCEEFNRDQDELDV